MFIYVCMFICVCVFICVSICVCVLVELQHRPRILTCICNSNQQTSISATVSTTQEGMAVSHRQCFSLLQVFLSLFLCLFCLYSLSLDLSLLISLILFRSFPLFSPLSPFLHLSPSLPPLSSRSED